ncbi:ribosome production factor 1 [Brevipalpus obovatus]|uniref:ribosome production factor 1 n=1 Tax=Brevipalpus obovatus TaxID=246614 RepID=UPI003D9E8D4A
MKLQNKLNQEEVIAKKKAKDERREEKAKSDAPKGIPRTIENTREPDDTWVDPEDEEVKEDESMDPMSGYFERQREPKVLITSSDNPHTKTIKFCRELKQTLETAEFRWRNRMPIKKMVKAASKRNYTHIIIVNEDHRKPNALLIIHLPKGPTAYFRMSSVRFCDQIKNRAKYMKHRPELIMNNFNTRMGHTVGRLITSMFHYDPQFHGRRVVTFHNQRDYIFFRQHRYQFKDGNKVALQEMGPRFTLRLKWVQAGTFDTKFGEYEWALKRHEMETSRRRFFI